MTIKVVSRGVVQKISFYKKWDIIKRYAPKDTYTSKMLA